MECEITLDEMLFLEALAKRDLGKNDEALHLFHKVLQIDPKRVDAYIEIGLLYMSNYDLDNAQVFFQTAVSLHPDFFKPYFYYALVYHQKKQYDHAIIWYDKALNYKSNLFEGYVNKGNIHFELNQFESAIICFEKGLEINPSFTTVFNFLASSLINVNRLAEAEKYILKNLQIDPKNHQSLYLKGIVHKRNKHIVQAIELFSLALRYDPNHFEALFNRAECYCELFEFHLAIRDFTTAASVAIEKKDLIPRYLHVSEWNLALIYLKLGEYVKGWELYEDRFNVTSLNNIRLFQFKPCMQNLDVHGKVILVYAEQGYGDVFQFCRYLLLLKEICKKVVFLVPKCVVDLIKMLSDDIIVIHEISCFDEIDLQVPLLSLPALFKTQVATIPRIESYLRCNDSYMHKWGIILGEKKKMRIGFVCTSGKDTQIGKVRDLPVKIFSALFNFPFEFHLLQTEIAKQDRDHLYLYDNVICHLDNIQDFSDTAAIISHMDLVISVDTGPAHLAAAIGKPVWIMLPIHADFRWMLNRSDSLWYKTVTLFRQQKADDWPNVINSVKEKLNSMFYDKS